MDSSEAIVRLQAPKPFLEFKPFLQLPIEIQLMICKEALTFEEPIAVRLPGENDSQIVPLHASSCRDKNNVLRRFDGSLGLFTVCRHLHSEVVKVFLSNNEFRLASSNVWSAFRRFLDIIGSTNANHLEHISLCHIGKGGEETCFNTWHCHFMNAQAQETGFNPTPILGDAPNLKILDFILTEKYFLYGKQLQWDSEWKSDSSKTPCKRCDTCIWMDKVKNFRPELQTRVIVTRLKRNRWSIGHTLKHWGDTYYIPGVAVYRYWGLPIFGEEYIESGVQAKRLLFSLTELFRHGWDLITTDIVYAEEDSAELENEESEKAKLYREVAQKFGPIPKVPESVPLNEGKV